MIRPILTIALAADAGTCSVGTASGALFVWEESTPPPVIRT